MQSLREKINNIVNSGNYAINQHAFLIEKLKPIYHHSISVIPHEISLPFNCFSFALDTIDSGRITEILKEDTSNDCRYGVKFGTDFINRMISGGFLVRDDNGSIIVYFKNGKPVHAGKIKNNRIVSKWGVGLLWEHDVWEIPNSYGDKNLRFRETDRESIEGEFIKYYAILKGNL